MRLGRTSTCSEKFQPLFKRDPRSRHISQAHLGAKKAARKQAVALKARVVEEQQLATLDQGQVYPSNALGPPKFGVSPASADFHSTGQAQAHRDKRPAAGKGRIV